MKDRPDRLRIFLHDVSVPLRIGYYETERHAPQTIIISVDLSLTALPDYRRIGEDLTQLLD